MLFGFHVVAARLRARPGRALRWYLWGHGRILRRQYEVRLVRVAAEKAAKRDELIAAVHRASTAACTLPVAMAHRLPVLVARAAPVAACSGGGGDDDDGASWATPPPPTKVTAPALPATPASGTGVGGRRGHDEPVLRHRVPARARRPRATPTLLSVTGAGTTANGVPFKVEVKRFATDSEVARPSRTRSATPTPPAILQVQRIEVDGEVSDLRDPDARGTAAAGPARRRVRHRAGRSAGSGRRRGPRHRRRRHLRSPEAASRSRISVRNRRTATCSTARGVALGSGPGGRRATTGAKGSSWSADTPR